MRPSAKLNRHRFVAVALLSLLCNVSVAGGWGGWGEVTQVEVIRSQGFLIFSTFTNVNACIRDNAYLVVIDHPQYDELYSMALAVMATGWRLQPHLAECQNVSWHDGTYNAVTSGGAIYARR